MDRTLQVMMVGEASNAAAVLGASEAGEDTGGSDNNEASGESERVQETTSTISL